MENYLLLGSYCLGCLICILLSIFDFQRNVPPYQDNKIRIAIFTFLFVLVVLVIYIFLLYLLVGLYISDKFPFIYVTGDSAEFSRYRLISPILLSVLYFGASKACLPIGGKDICLYSVLLKVFVGFLTVPLDQEALLRIIKQKQVDSLESFHKQSIDKAKSLDIKIPEEGNTLSKIQNEINVLSERIDFLKDIQSRRESLSDALFRLEKHMDKIREDYLVKLKNSVKLLVEINTSNLLFADFAIRYFDIIPRVRLTKEVSLSNLFVRTIAMAIIGALALSLTYEGRSEFDVIQRIPLLSLSLLVFLFWFIWLDRFSWSIDHLLGVILLGMAAGASGAIMFDIINPNHSIFSQWGDSLTNNTGDNSILHLKVLIDNIQPYNVLRGLLMGGTASFIVYLFRYVMVKRIDNMLILYVVLACAGFITFSFGELIWFVFSIDIMSMKNDLWKMIWPSSMTVAVLTIVIGLVSNILHAERRVLNINLMGDQKIMD